MNNLLNKIEKSRQRQQFIKRYISQLNECQQQNIKQKANYYINEDNCQISHKIDTSINLYTARTFNNQEDYDDQNQFLKMQSYPNQSSLFQKQQFNNNNNSYLTLFNNLNSLSSLRQNLTLQSDQPQLKCEEFQQQINLKEKPKDNLYQIKCSLGKQNEFNILVNTNEQQSNNTDFQYIISQIQKKFKKTLSQKGIQKIILKLKQQTMPKKEFTIFKKQNKTNIYLKQGKQFINIQNYCISNKICKKDKDLIAKAVKLGKNKITL